MKIYAVKNGKFNRSQPLANIRLFHSFGGYEGEADNGWPIRTEVGYNYGPGFDWSKIPDDVNRIAFCTGKIDGKWDWQYLVRSLEDITPEERKRELDRRKKNENDGEDRYFAVKKIVDTVENMDAAEKSRFFRIKTRWPYETTSGTFYQTAKSHLDKADERNSKWISDYVLTHIEVLNRALELHKKYSPTPIPKGISAPEGKQTVSGKILSVKWKEGQFSGYKMLVELENKTKVYGSVPAALVDKNPDSGDYVEFTATFVQSKDDLTFGFFSRPKLVNHKKG